MGGKQFAAVALVIVGILAIILGCCAFGLDTGYSEGDKAYGGDAYTGIQNATAQTARNLVKLTEAVSFSAGSVLLISGLALMAAGIAVWPSESAYIPAITGNYAENTWACVCGKRNSNIVAVCACGRRKQQAEGPLEKQEQPGAHTPNGWRCTCGREHPAYVSTCPCGVNKRDIL